jgi:hypothetical protein
MRTSTPRLGVEVAVGVADGEGDAVAVNVGEGVGERVMGEAFPEPVSTTAGGVLLGDASKGVAVGAKVVAVGTPVDRKDESPSGARGSRCR